MSADDFEILSEVAVVLEALTLGEIAHALDLLAADYRRSGLDPQSRRVRGVAERMPKRTQKPLPTVAEPVADVVGWERVSEHHARTGVPVTTLRWQLRTKRLRGVLRDGVWLIDPRQPDQLERKPA